MRLLTRWPPPLLASHLLLRRTSARDASARGLVSRRALSLCFGPAPRGASAPADAGAQTLSAG
eukprot:12030032-Alexandrium_andersonii.AAC.1